MKYIYRIIAFINLLIILGLAVTGYVGQADPRIMGIAITSGYFLPVFIVANFLMLVFWIFVKWKYAILPILGFIVCYQPVSLYTPLHATSDVPEGALKIMSYNTWSFGLAEENTDTTSSRERCRNIMQNIVEENADIVCLQESGVWRLVEEVMDTVIRPVYPYVQSSHENRGIGTMVFSKYPINKSELVEYETEGNYTTAFYLDVDGKQIIVLNCHLETVHFSYDDKKNFSSLVNRKLSRGESKSKTKLYAHRLADSSKIRAAQADAIAAFVEKHSGESILLCGDFNDIPNSYTHRRIAEKLNDCYRETGFGPGFSYKRYGMKVRIDNVMTTDDFTPYNFEVKSQYAGSDHYPLVGYVKFNR